MDDAGVSSDRTISSARMTACAAPGPMSPSACSVNVSVLNSRARRVGEACASSRSADRTIGKGVHAEACCQFVRLLGADCAVFDVLANAEVRKEISVLIHDADAAAFGRQRRYVPIVENDVS